MSEDSRTIALLRQIIIALISLLVFVGIGLIIYKRVTARRLRLATLNTKVRELELTAIRAQMNPHFLYNSLNSIQNLVQKAKTEEAYTYLSKFAKLIRSVLNQSSREEISLHEELEMIDQYVKLEQLRFDFNFNRVIDEETDTYSLFIPPLLLQPIVENAIIHGLAPKSGEKSLSIRVHTSKYTTCITVEDNGVGRHYSSDNSEGNGKGLTFSKERLAHLTEQTGMQHNLEINDQTDEESRPTGTKVKICFSID